MESRSKTIESEKLKAIGLGNRVDTEQETRKRKQLELQAMVNERKAELERLNAQRASTLGCSAQIRPLLPSRPN